MRILNWIAAAATALVLTACGGGGGSAGTSPFVSTPAAPASSASAAATAASVEVLSSATQIGSGGDTATITAVVKDSGNASLTGAPITLTADSGILTVASNTTGSNGTITATLTPGANKSNRIVTVTATSGTVSSSVKVSVADTKLSYAGSTTIALTKAEAVGVKLVDSKGSPISGATVTVASSLSNGLSAATLTTDAQGVASLTYTATNAGTDRLTFTSSGTTVVAQIQISGENFAFVSPAAATLIPVSTSQAVTVRYLQGGVPKANQAVTFSVTAGTVTPASVLTDANGQATALINSTTASPAIVQAALQGLVAQATLAVEFVAVTPANLVLQVAPSALAPNAVGSTTQQAQLIATVSDASGNPVKGTTVSFNRLADPSGGNLNQATAVTDSSGRATVQYIAGGSTTANNGIKLRATVASTPTVFGDATLTVNQSALFIALGTGNVIGNLDPQTYKKDWVVYVTDSNGVAVPNATLTMSILPLAFGKGQLVYDGTVWTYKSDVVFCANEDVNYNGTVDAGEDFNGNGSLQPGGVISVSPGKTTTDSTGRATISVTYAESYAPWVQVALRATTTVTGTESSKEVTFVVGGLSSDFTDKTVTPAGAFSPFGTVTNCLSPN